MLFASPSFTAPCGLTLKRIVGADVETGPVDLVADRYYTTDPARLSFPSVERFVAIETVFVEGIV